MPLHQLSLAASRLCLVEMNSLVRWDGECCTTHNPCSSSLSRALALSLSLSHTFFLSHTMQPSPIFSPLCLARSHACSRFRSLCLSKLFCSSSRVLRDSRHAYNHLQYNYACDASNFWSNFWCIKSVIRLGSPQTCTTSCLQRVLCTYIEPITTRDNQTLLYRVYVYTSRGCSRHLKNYVHAVCCMMLHLQHTWLAITHCNTRTTAHIDSRHCNAHFDSKHCNTHVNCNTLQLINLNFTCWILHLHPVANVLYIRLPIAPAPTLGYRPVYSWHHPPTAHNHTPCDSHSV